MEPSPENIERVLVDALDPLEDSELVDRDDWVQLTTPSSPHAHHNVVAVARIDADPLQPSVKQVLDRYRELGNRCRWVVGPSSRPAGLAEAVRACGLPHIGDGVGMVRAVATARPLAVPGLELRRATAEDTDDYTELTVREAGREPAFAEAVRSAYAGAMGREDVSFWLAHLGGELVATATLRVMKGRSAGLGYFQGATVDARHQGRGIYRALCEYRLARLGELGITHAVVWGNPETSAPRCERMGFEPITRASFFEG